MWMMCAVVANKASDHISMLDVTRPVDVPDGPHLTHTSTTRLRDSTIKRGHTISGVTAEAGAVFEHLLRRTHSDSSSSDNRRVRPVSRRQLPVISEVHADESTDNWTADITRDSIDTRLSSFNGLDEVDVRPSRISVQSGDGSRQASRDTLDVFDSSGTRLSSTDGLDDARLGATQSNRYFQQFSKDSADLIVSSGMSDRHTAASMSVDLADVSDDEDDERRQKEEMPKKKKSVFQRVRERLRATFSRSDRSRASRKADKYMHANGETSRQNWLTASFRRRKRKHSTDHRGENGSAATSNHLKDSVNSNSGPQSRNTIDRRATYDVAQHKPKGLLTSVHRRLSSIRVKRSQSPGSSMLSVSVQCKNFPLQ